MSTNSWRVEVSRSSRRRAPARSQLACAVCAQDVVRRLVHPARYASGALKGSAVLRAVDVASRVMLGVLAFYRREVTPFLPPNCRFVPSCSAYMVEAISEYGAQRGFVLSAWRVLRCNPTGGSGYDPVQWPPVPYKAGS